MKYYLVYRINEHSFSVETDEKNFNSIVDHISKRYEVQTDAEIDGSIRYFMYDGESYNLIGCTMEG